MPYRYIVECSDGSLYVGSTWDLERRLGEPAQGEGARCTACRLLVRLLYCEEHERVEDAFSREKQVQNWSRAKRFALLQGRVADIKSNMK